MSAPRFTILMPTHYRPDVIGYAIRSVLAQTLADFELLVVGDGAVAGTVEVVKAFDDPRIRWFDLPKAPGYGYANRNIAMADARGDLVAFAADDDILLPDYLECFAAPFADPAVQWTCSQVLWVSRDGVAAPDLTNLDFGDERRFFVERQNTLAGGAVVYRRGALGDTPWPDVARAADWRMTKALIERHGIAAMRRLPFPTYLHFTAGLKLDRDSHFSLLAAWLDRADRAAWWPVALRADPAPGMPVQAAYLERLADPAYLARLRLASSDVVNRAALDGLAPRLGAAATRRRIRRGIALGFRRFGQLLGRQKS